ncbi:hypothetical protein NM208_g12041 [Fusarium decemcellulare]|uniref:Uncharacterized protein n=1 Tax=Fusarium decemcellulare TaxID=57161 RepID=A0ACC1RQW8_9HYPO|nr:hypothetical protein NM208_g12041 [Fusarium decemcellulare]
MATYDLPSQNNINLSYAALGIFGVLLLPSVYITWKHGKAGIICWPIFVSFFGLRFVSDAYLIIHKDDVEEPNTVTLMTNAGSIVCLSLTLIGMVYEAVSIVPSPSRRLGRKIMLGVTHLANTVGIGMAAYAGKADENEPGGVKNETLNKIGNLLIFLVMVVVLFWLWPAAKRVLAARQETNYKAAKVLLIAVVPGTVLQLIRLSYSLTYAFNRIPSLDPVTGSFATRLILMFGTQLFIVLVVIAGGWMSKDVRPNSQVKVRGEANGASISLVDHQDGRVV